MYCPGNDVTTNWPISERRDDEAGRVAKILVRVPELRVADVGEAVADAVVPAVPELAEPQEGLRVLHFLLNQFGDHVSGVHVDGTDGHDLLTVAFWQLANQHAD